MSGEKEMYVGEKYAGMLFYDYLGHVNDSIVIDCSGKGKFKTAAKSVSVYIKK